MLCYRSRRGGASEGDDDVELVIWCEQYVCLCLPCLSQVSIQAVVPFEFNETKENNFFFFFILKFPFLAQFKPGLILCRVESKIDFLCIFPL